MSDEMERRLREAGRQLPGPAPDDTLTARSRFLAAAPAQRRGPLRRAAALALVAALAVAGAFGVGYALAASKTVTKTVTKTRVIKEGLNAGPGFLPSDGWATSVVLDPETGSIVGATATRNGTRISATFAPASTRPRLAQRLLPLQLPAGSARRHLAARVGAYAVEVTVRFASAKSPSGTLAAAREEVGRITVPSCPNAQPLTRADVEAAKRYVLAWLPAHYQGNPSDVQGATATGALGTDMPRYGEATADCGATVAASSVEVDLTLPRLEQVSASLSQLTYFVARTSTGWTVWERAH